MATQNQHKQVRGGSLKDRTLSKKNTSQKIRFLASQGKSVKEIEDLLEEYGVQTKDNGHIRYQHVRNVLMTRLSSDNDNANA